MEESLKSTNDVYEPATSSESYEETVEVIRTAMRHVEPCLEHDIATVNKLERFLDRVDGTRATELERLEADDKQLNSTLRRINQEYTHQTSRRKALNYQQKMAELQKESFDMAKDLSELETNANWALGELSKLRNELTVLDARSVPQEVVVGPDLVELEMARRHGLQLTVSGSLLVQSPNDVHIVALDDETPTHEQCEAVWRLSYTR